MNKVSVFNFKSNPVRSITKDGEPWFVASDVCGALGLENVSMAVARLDDDEKADISIVDTSSFGRNCKKLCEEVGIKVGDVPDERFGSVHSYPVEVLREVLEGTK